MLDPDAITTAVVTAIQSIPEVVAVLSADATRIVGHYYRTAAEPSLIEAIYQMIQPSILVAYDAMLAGNFDGATIFKHRVNIFARIANQAGAGSPIGLGHLWWLVANKAVLGGTRNIRYTEILSGLDIMDTPGMVIKQDEDGQDLLYGTMVFPELGDN